MCREPASVYIRYFEAHKAESKRVIEAKRNAKRTNSFFVEPESKIALVIRIRGINKHHPDVRKILKLFRLRQLHNATLVKLNKATTNMLRRVEPFITFGYPTRKTL
jgi:large subunit ribosomal protein L7e